MYKQLELIWSILADYREYSIPEGEPMYDELWDEITDSMISIQEGLGIYGNDYLNGLEFYERQGQLDLNDDYPIERNKHLFALNYAQSKTKKGTENA